MVDDDRQRIRTAQQEGIAIAKQQGKYPWGKKRYHTAATGKDKVIYERVVQLLSENRSVVDIHREVEISRNTIYTIKAEL